MLGPVNPRWRLLLPAALIAAAGVWVYAPAMGGNWLWDDDLYVTDNPLLRSGAGLGKIWFAPSGLNYFPVTATVQWLQWHLWGDRPLGYHLTNVGLHLASAFLFWRLLQKLGVRLGWLGGLLFAVHPVAVESVAWISEIKNTLSLPPLLAALAAYIDYDERGRRGDYLAAVLWFLLAMLCKSTVAMFPCALLLYVGWKRGRWRRADWAASGPFFAIALGLGLVTVGFEHRQLLADTSAPSVGLLSRLSGAGLAIPFYLFKAVLPVRLLPIYPLWRVNPPQLWQWWPWPALAALVGGLWAQRAAWGRDVLLGLGWFVLGLVPILGLVGMAYLRLSRVADHFAYLSLLGPIGLAAAALSQLTQRPAPAPALAWGATAAVIAALACSSHAYAGVFLNQDRLWSYAVARNPGSWSAHFYLANIRRQQSRLPEAVGEYRQAARLNPEAPEVRVNLGLALEASGRRAEAIAAYEAALRISPRSADAHTNLGLLLLQGGRPTEAIRHLEQAAELRPEAAEIQINLGNALTSVGRGPEAILPWDRAVRLQPNSAAAQEGLGIALAMANRPAEATAHYERAVLLQPNSAEFHNNLAVALAATDRLPEAIRQYREVLRLKPEAADAHFNLGNALAESGQLAAAVAEYAEAARLNPADAGIHHNLGVTLRALGRTEEAQRELDEAAQLPTQSP